MTWRPWTASQDAAGALTRCCWARATASCQLDTCAIPLYCSPASFHAPTASAPSAMHTTLLAAKALPCSVPGGDKGDQMALYSWVVTHFGFRNCVGS